MAKRTLIRPLLLLLVAALCLSLAACGQASAPTPTATVSTPLSKASGSGTSGTTGKRGAMEFSELYMNRLTDYIRKSGQQITVSISSDVYYNAPADGEQIISVHSSAGLMEIDLSDFSVKSLTMTTNVSDAGNEKNMQNIMICLAAISALEYDQIEGDILALRSKVNGGPDNVMTCAEEIMESIVKAVQDGASAQVYDTGHRVLVYSGNYDYYYDIFDTNRQDGSRVLIAYLIAEARP